MTTITWDCKVVDLYPLEGEYTNVVYNVHWIITGVSDQLDAEEKPYTGTVFGFQALDTSNVTNFVPFEDLTNEITTQWVKDAMGTARVTNFELATEKQINEKINPSSVTMTIGEPIPPA